VVLFFSLVLKEAVIGIIWDTAHKRIAVGMKKPGDHYFSGRWHIPGEKIEEGESDETALIRLGIEELSIGITVIKFLANHNSPTGRIVRWYECQAHSDLLHPGSDLVDATWIPHLQVPNHLQSDTMALWPEKIKDFFKIS